MLTIQSFDPVDFAAQLHLWGQSQILAYACTTLDESRGAHQGGVETI